MEHLSVPGTIESLATVRAYVKAAAGAAGLSRQAVYRLVLAVDEVATNIATHGYVGVAPGMVAMRAELDEASLTIQIEDTGAEYALPAPAEVDLPLEQRKIGGFGLLLARRNVDELHYQRFGGRNRHILIVYRNPS
jgi:serine/threonine-protein kinase RsbW